MAKVSIKSKTILYPMPAVLVGSMIKGRANFMTVAWCGIAAHEPPAITLGLQKKRLTLVGMLESREFSVNIPSTSLVEKVDFCGLYSGRERDKSKLFKIFFGQLKNAPLIEECPINLGCYLLKLLDMGSHDLVIAEIKEVLVDENCMDNERIDPYKVDPLIYLTSSHKYAKIGPLVADAFKVGKIKDEQKY